MFDWQTVVSIFFDLQLPPLAPNIVSCFSKHLEAVFFFFQLHSLTSSVLQWHSWRRQFILKIWPIQLTFLRRILFRNVLFSPIRSRTCSLVTFSFSSQYLLLFLKSSRSCVLLPTLFTSVICPSTTSWRGQDVNHSFPLGGVGRGFPFPEDETRRHFSYLVYGLEIPRDPRHFLISFLLPSWRAVRSYRPHLEERDPIWGDD